MANPLSRTGHAIVFGVPLEEGATRYECIFSSHLLESRLRAESVSNLRAIRLVLNLLRRRGCKVHAR